MKKGFRHFSQNPVCGARGIPRKTAKPPEPTQKYETQKQASTLESTQTISIHISTIPRPSKTIPLYICHCLFMTAYIEVHHPEIDLPQNTILCWWWPDMDVIEEAV
jgi:hypothetical protein